jgi:DNA primase
VVIMFDTDEAGRKAAVEIALRLVHKLYVRIVDVPEGKQPDEFSTVELHELLRAVWKLQRGPSTGWWVVRSSFRRAVRPRPSSIRGQLRRGAHNPPTGALNPQ